MGSFILGVLVGGFAVAIFALIDSNRTFRATIDIFRHYEDWLQRRLDEQDRGDWWKR